jgi:(2Fe-2S) ferredoxin
MIESMSYYKYHLFICTNQRDDGKGCCQDFDSESARQYMKQRAKQLDIHGAGQCRINNAGCLNRCKSGPVMVIYPEETWYTWVDRSDLDEIVDKHLLKGEIVERLRIPAIETVGDGNQ